MTKQATPEQNAAYIAHLCMDLCGRPQAPGMPRCDDCNRIHHQTAGENRER